MSRNQSPSTLGGVKPLTALIGAPAVVASGAMTMGLDRDDSGHAPTNIVYAQPNVAGMTMGATATTTTPRSVPETTEAKPAIKAGS